MATCTASLDPALIVTAFVASVLTGGLCGLAPALQVGRIPLIASLKERARSASPGGIRLRKALVVGQIAFTLILLIGAGLFVQTLRRLYENVGFASSGLVMVSIDPPGMGYAEPDAERVMRRVFERLQALPVVGAVAIGNATLLSGGMSSLTATVQSDERIVARDLSRMRVGPGFFATLGLPVVAGREFETRDVRPPGAPPTRWRTVIVNESFARRYFAGRSPVGYHLGLGNRPDTETDIEIIGVVRDFSRRTLRDAALEQVFFPFWDQNSGDGTFYVKVRGEPAGTFAALGDAVREVDALVPVSVRSFDDQVEESLGPERMLAALASGFSAIALLLSVVGLYGVMSFVALQRTREIGLRMALGATRAAAVWLISRDVAIMIALGMALALPAAWALRRLIETQLYGVGAFHAPTIALASGVLAIVGVAAATLPAWRAASVSPTEALRLD